MQNLYTPNQIIVNALYLIGELGVGETPDAFMLSSGLELLNEIIGKLNADSFYVPFLSTIDFTMTPGQASYSFSDLVSADFTLDMIVDLVFANYAVNSGGNSIIYPLKIIQKSQYYNNTRLTPFNTRPCFVFLDKQSVESNIVFYPAPDKNYECSLQLKVMLDRFVANEVVVDMAPVYYGFLKYALARKFLSYYPSGNWPQTAEQEYQDYYELVTSTSDTDLTVRPSQILHPKDSFYWQNILAY